MPKYRNDGPFPRIVPGLAGLSVTVRPGEAVETYSILTGPGWTKVSDEPYAPLTSIRKSVTAPGSVSGLRDTALISLVADAAGIVVTPNAAGNEHGFELPKGAVVEIENLGEIDTLYFAGTGKVLVQAGDGIVSSPGALRMRRGRGSSGAAPVPPAHPAPSYPASLKLFWLSSNHQQSVLGPAPQYSGSPVVDQSGVAPGHGPSFAAIPELNAEGTLVVRFTATKGSSALTGKEHIFGSIYASQDGLVCNDGSQEAVFRTSWKEDDVVTAIVQVWAGKMRVGRA